MNGLKHYLPDPPQEITRHNCIVAEWDMTKLRLLKLARSVLFGLLIGGLGLLGILEGGDPTLIALGTIAAIVVVSGAEISEYLAARRAILKQGLDAVKDEGDDGG